MNNFSLKESAFSNDKAFNQVSQLALPEGPLSTKTLQVNGRNDLDNYTDLGQVL